MKKINLEEIAKSLNIEFRDFDKALFTGKQMKSISIEFGRQLLELAAENAKMYKERNVFEDNVGELVIDKESITNTINQVE